MEVALRIVAGIVFVGLVFGVLPWALVFVAMRTTSVNSYHSFARSYESMAESYKSFNQSDKAKELLGSRDYCTATASFYALPWWKALITRTPRESDYISG